MGGHGVARLPAEDVWCLLMHREQRIDAGMHENVGGGLKIRDGVLFEKFPMVCGNVAQSGSLAIGGKGGFAAKMVPDLRRRLISACMKHQFFMIPAKSGHAIILRKSEDPIQDTCRVRTAIDVVTQEDEVI